MCERKEDRGGRERGGENVRMRKREVKTKAKGGRDSWMRRRD